MEGLAQSLALHPWAWLAVLALGGYHGVNPGMGWLLAVSNGLQARRGGAVFAALPPIALGHFLAMVAAWLPFALLGLYLQESDGVRFAAGAVLVAFGVHRLARRHPRYLARVGPSRIVLWSFLMATAHGAGLMLVPVILGLCGDDSGRQAMTAIGSGGASLALLAAAVHTFAMLATGALIAWLVYRYLGLRLLGRSWLNVELLWGLLLVGAGGVALGAAAG